MSIRQRCLLLGALALVAWFGAAPLGTSSDALAGENAAAVKEFGTSRSEPIDGGFFFWDYEYVDAPYVVERRGLDVYINDKLVKKGPEWPQYDYEVKEDPGDPPDRSLPWDIPPGVDPRDTYWARKYRYVFQHHDFETAKRVMAEAHRKSPSIREVTKHEERPDVYVVVTDSGRRKRINLSWRPRRSRTDDDDLLLLAAARGRKSGYVSQLEGDGFLLRSGGFTCTVAAEGVRKMMSILVSPLGGDEKLRLLEANRILITKGHRRLQEFVTGFEPSPALLERLGGRDRLPLANGPEARASGGETRPSRREHPSHEKPLRDGRWVERVKERNRWRRDFDPGQVPQDVPVKKGNRENPGQGEGKLHWLVLALWAAVGATALAFLTSRLRKTGMKRD